jgi:hypothetical protein
MPSTALALFHISNCRAGRFRFVLHDEVAAGALVFAETGNEEIQDT